MLTSQKNGFSFLTEEQNKIGAQYLIFSSLYIVLKVKEKPKEKWPNK